jgi:hypothetical protein
MADTVGVAVLYSLGCYLDARVGMTSAFSQSDNTASNFPGSSEGGL